MPASFDDFFFTYQALIYTVGTNGLLALSMYAVLSAGQLSLGQAAFMGIGAYVSALATVKLGVPFAVALGAGMLAPALAAALIGVPTLRLSGVYLALATIGFGEVVRIFYLNSDTAGGALGLAGIPQQGGAWLIYLCLAAALAVFMAIGRSRIGRAMEAMREDETAASVMGVNVPLYRFSALIASAVLAGLAGALSADVSSFIGPNEYGFDQAVTILSFALLGGIGSPYGPVLGAIILTLLPEVLRPLHDFRFAVNGLIIVIAVLFMPRGLLAWRFRRIGAAAGERP
ncbi:MAG: branched-chain amino acid ABC transporter permease [Rhodomicrobium sp.]